MRQHVIFETSVVFMSFYEVGALFGFDKVPGIISLDVLQLFRDVFDEHH